MHSSVFILYQSTPTICADIAFFSHIFKLSCLNKYNWFNWNDTGRMELPESTIQYISMNKERDMNAAKQVGGHH